MRRRHRQRKNLTRHVRESSYAAAWRSGDQRAYNAMLQAVRNNAPSERTCALTQSQSSKYRGQIGAMEPPICWRVSHRSILEKRQRASAGSAAQQKWQTSVRTNFAAAYWISVTSMPTVGLLLRASNVTPAAGGTGRAQSGWQQRPQRRNERMQLLPETTAVVQYTLARGCHAS